MILHQQIWMTKSYFCNGGRGLTNYPWTRTKSMRDRKRTDFSTKIAESAIVELAAFINFQNAAVTLRKLVHCVLSFGLKISSTYLRNNTIEQISHIFNQMH